GPGVLNDVDPGKNNPSLMPGFPQAFAGLQAQHAVLVIMGFFVGPINTGVDQNRAQPVVMVDAASQHQQAGMGGNDDPHGVGDAQPIAAIKTLFIQENQNQGMQTLLEFRRQEPVQVHVAF